MEAIINGDIVKKSAWLFILILAAAPSTASAKNKEFDFKNKLLGHWQAHEKNGSSGGMDDENIYISTDSIAVFINDGTQTFAYPYSITVLDAKRRRIKLTVYSTKGEISLEELLTFSEDGKSIRHQYLTENSVPEKEFCVWKYADAKQSP